MLELINFSFPGASLTCFGPTEAIQDINNYFSLRNAPGKTINMLDFIDRIISNKIYARFEGKHLTDHIHCIIYGYNRRLKQSNLYMSKADLTEASILFKPDKVKSFFHLTDEEITFAQNNSIWNKRFPQ